MWPSKPQSYLHSTFEEITDVLVSFRDQVKRFPDDLLLCVFILQNGGRQIRTVKPKSMESSLCFVGLNSSSEQFYYFEMGKEDNLHVSKWGLKQKLSAISKGL